MEELIKQTIPFFVTIILVIFAFYFTRFILNQQSKGKAQKGLIKSIILFVIAVLGIIAIILALPMSDDLRSQISGLIGIVIAAVLSLSSATFIGNGLAGIMIRSIDNFKLGDTILVNDILGRVSERGLFHTEIQTEDRDLVTVPNLMLTTNPVKVKRTSGTIVSATCSLGYDVSRIKVEKALIEAAVNAGLSDPYMYVMELGDFSIVYKIHGMLNDINTFFSQKSSLQAMMLDSLHKAGIEIVSPTFMNQRQIKDQSFIPKKSRIKQVVTTPSPEQLVFDKADEAQTIEVVRIELKVLEEKIKRLETELKKELEVTEKEGIKNKITKLESTKKKKRNWIENQLIKIEKEP